MKGEPKLKPKFQEIDISKIYVSEANVRKMKITKGELESLVASIKEKGILQPVVLVQRGDRYELPVGQCRFLAAKEAGLKKIPAMVYDDLSPVEMRVISAIENLQRIDLSEADRAAAVYDLKRELGTNKAVAKALGYSEGWVSYMLGFKGLPDEVKEMVEKKELTTQEAASLRHMLKWKPPKEVVEVAKEIAKIPKKDTRSRETRKMAVTLAKRMPTLTREELIKRAVRKTSFIKFTISISDTELDALKRASEDEDERPEDLAHRIINEWLVDNDYISKEMM
jgi:ParB family chromosome partitioning protein